MVYFVCSTCGTCLKKNQVSTHWFKCRRDKHVSCMDCGKEFWGEDYSSHVKCITEDEKYGGSKYVAKENKGNKKQEEWIMKIKEKVASSHNMEPQLRELLQRIVQHSNIPRKEKKFRNYMDSLNVSNPKLVDRVWEVFKEANTRSGNNNSSSGVKSGVCVTEEADSNDKETSNKNNHKESSETEKNDSDSVKLNKRERKELRREKQGKKSKRDKHGEHSNNTKSSTKRKLDNNEEPNLETIEPRKKNKRRKGDDSLVEEEQVIETAEPGNKKKKKKEGTLQEEAPVQGESGSLTTNANHTMEQNNEDPTQSQRPSSFKWTTAIKRVLQDAPEEGLKVSKLRRKVFSLYYAAHGEAVNVKSKQELTLILDKKLKKKNKFSLHKDKVKLQKK